MMRKLYTALISVLFALNANAATFSLFSPATGVLKGSASTYVTTAATSTDVVGLWSGVCTGANYLGADGSCHSAASGTVTSVALTVPSGLSVSGSPVTTSGTLAITTALTGPIKGTGTGFTAAASADIRGLWSGTCNSSTFLRGDGACASAGGGSPGGSNTQVQYNSSGSFAGSADFAWDNAGTTLTVNGDIFVSSDAGATGVDLGTGGIGFSQNINADGGIDIRLLAAGTGAIIGLKQSNDVSHVFRQGITSTTYSGAVFTNGPTGEAAFFGTDNSVPVSIGINGTERERFYTDGGVTVGAPTGGSKGAGTLNATGLYVNGSAVVGGTPGGSTTQIQFNDAGSFNGDSQLTWDNVSKLLETNDGAGNDTQIFAGGVSVGTNDNSFSYLQVDNQSTGASAAAVLATSTLDSELQVITTRTTYNGNICASSATTGAQVAFCTTHSVPVKTYTGGTLRQTINTDGGVTVGSPTGGSQGAGTLNATGLYVAGVAVATATSGTGTPTWNGFSAVTPPLVTYSVIDHQTCISYSGTVGTSNATTFTISSLPVSVGTGARIIRVVDAGTAAVGYMTWSGTTITFFTSVASGAFTASGNKGTGDFNECFRT